MTGLGNRDDDELFNFSDQIFGNLSNTTSPKKHDRTLMPSNENEIHTSYILVNALLNLLIQKGVIHRHEVNGIVAELHELYLKKKRG